MAALCARCGAKKGHSVHIKALGLAQYHPWEDASKVGIKPVSEGRQAYKESEAHREAYAANLRGPECAVAAAGGPGQCFGPMTPHHVAPRSKVGGLEAADKYPVVNVCARHNGAIQDDAETRAWATTHYITIGNRDYPFLVTDEWLTAERERTARL